MLESSIQAAIIKALEKKGWYCIKIMKSNKNGVPDLMALKDGEVLFIEIKRPGNNPTPLQLHRHKELSAQGFKVIIATSVYDLD